MRGIILIKSMFIGFAIASLIPLATIVFYFYQSSLSAVETNHFYQLSLSAPETNLTFKTAINLFVMKVTIGDMILIGSVFVVIVGWFVSAGLNHENEIAKRRLDHRLEMLKSFIPFAAVLYKYGTPDFAGRDPFKEVEGLAQKFEEVQLSFQLYGHQDEIKKMEDFTKDLKSGDTKKQQESVHKIAPLVRNNIRKELGLEAVSKDSWFKRLWYKSINGVFRA